MCSPIIASGISRFGTSSIRSFTNLETSFLWFFLRTLSILRQGQQSYCSNLAGFFCFAVAVLLFAAEGVSCLTPVL